MTRQTLTLALGALSACAEPMSPIPAECNPLGGQGCLLPWPSMAYARHDTKFSSTGFRLAIPSEGTPRNHAGAWIHPSPYNRWDGFSTLGPLIARFDVDVAASTVPVDPDASLDGTSSIVLLDATTGERAPFTVETDGDTLVMQPVRRLRPGHRHVVAIRDRVRAIDGAPLPVSEGFAALRDGHDYPHPRFAAVREGAREMFDALAAHGISRDELVLAWDFVTATDDFVRGDLVTMHNQAQPPIGPDGEYLTFTLEPAGNGRYAGTVLGPSFLAPSGTGLHRDDWEWHARPMLDSLRDARFAVLVPPCATGGVPRPAILVGHELFGTASGTLDDPFVQAIASEHCAIVIATEHTGLAANHRELASKVMADLTHVAVVTENLAQSMIDLYSIAALVRGPLARTLPIDPANVTYLGRSLGGIVGATYLAYESAPVRAAIAPTAWLSPELVAMMTASYPRDEHALNVALLAMAFEPYDPRVTAGAISHDVLVWSAMGDTGAETLARDMGLPVLAPTVMSPWGMELATEPTSRGLVIYDNATRETPALERQFAQVIAGAPLTMQCALAGSPAPCDCATGACD